MLTKEVEVLQKAPLFRKLPAGRIKLLAYAGELVTCEAGDYLFRHGDPSDAAYTIFDGDVEATIPGPEEDVVVGQFGAGDVVGEVGVFTGNPRSLSIRARTRTNVLRIPAEVLTDLIHDCPACAASITAFMAGLVERLIDRVSVASHH